MDKVFDKYMTAEERKFRILCEAIGHTAFVAKVSIPAEMYSEDAVEYACTKLAFTRRKLEEYQRDVKFWRCISMLLSVVLAMWIGGGVL